MQVFSDDKVLANMVWSNPPNITESSEVRVVIITFMNNRSLEGRVIVHHYIHHRNFQHYNLSTHFVLFRSLPYICFKNVKCIFFRHSRMTISSQIWSGWRKNLPPQQPPPPSHRCHLLTMRVHVGKKGTAKNRNW